MLLDPETLELDRRRAGAGRSTLAGDPLAPKLELPASQVELVSAPATHGRRGDRRRSPTADARCSPPARGSPARRSRARTRSAPPTVSSTAARATTASASEYGCGRRVASCVCALQVHVAVGGADRTLAVYNALRAESAGARGAGGQRAVPRGSRLAVSRRSGRCSRACYRARASPPPIASWGELRGRPRAGARRRDASRSRRRGGGSCARTSATGRSSCASPTPRPRSPTRRPSRRSPTPRRRPRRAPRRR